MKDISLMNDIELWDYLKDLNEQMRRCMTELERRNKPLSPDKDMIDIMSMKVEDYCNKYIGSNATRIATAISVMAECKDSNNKWVPDNRMCRVFLCSQDELKRIRNFGLKGITQLVDSIPDPRIKLGMTIREINELCGQDMFETN